ncbi:hypothetical protein EVAR_22039_1 [Eumeta japonica]|uniref:Uncharacterized protein n=1 Tax=Eumeta variegata TaxID=151549 RepID=A0A4C1UTR8_EUMVA|nr:hypothetical protein EVAR_22039_1 [Eumeta japonica]
MNRVAFTNRRHVSGFSIDNIVHIVINGLLSFNFEQQRSIICKQYYLMNILNKASNDSARAEDELRELVVKTGMSVKNVSKALATSVSSFKISRLRRKLSAGPFQAISAVDANRVFVQHLAQALEGARESAALTRAIALLSRGAGAVIDIYFGGILIMRLLKDI